MPPPMGNGMETKGTGMHKGFMFLCSRDRVEWQSVCVCKMQGLGIQMGEIGRLKEGEKDDRKP